MSRQTHDRALLFVLVASLLGVYLSLSLTTDTFALEFQTLPADDGECPPGFPCSRALESPASHIVTIPTSIHATGLYFVLAALSVLLLRSREALHGVASPLLLVLAWAGVMSSLGLFVYGLVNSLAFCRSCVTLHTVNVAIAAVVLAWIEPPWRSDTRERWSRLTRRRHDTVRGLFPMLYLLVIAIGSQAIVYELYGRATTPAPAKIAARVAPPLPTTPIQFGDHAPGVIVAAFLDPACSDCREMFITLTRLVKTDTSVPVALHLYMTPRDPEGRCVPSALVNAFTDQRSQAHLACEAGVAVECMEHVGRGLGVKLMRRLYQRTMSGEKPYFSEKAVTNAAKRTLGLERGDEFKRFEQCRQTNETVRRRIQGYTRYIYELDDGPARLPTLLFSPAGASDRPINRLSALADTRDIMRYIDATHTQGQAGG